MAGFYNPNQSMINQLMRQKDNIDNMINQYSQPPVQNIINTGMPLDFEARILKDDEDVQNIFINKRTMFLDKKNKKLIIKEIDGKISEEYEIILPLDEKDKKIIELEKKLKEMEEKINVQHSELVKPNNDGTKSYTNVNGDAEPATKAGIGDIQKPIERETSSTYSTTMQPEGHY